MHSISLGYSTSIDDKSFFRLLEPNPNNEQNRSDVELHFQCDYIRPGCFECYSREDYKSAWSEGLIRKLLPFELPEEVFRGVDIDATRIVFYIESGCDFFARPHHDLKFISRMEIEGYLYES